MTSRVFAVRLSKGQVSYLEEQTKIYGSVSDAIRAHIPEKGTTVKNYVEIKKTNEGKTSQTAKERRT